MLTLSQAEIDALDSDTQRIGVFFRLAVDPAVRLWLGIGDIAAGVNAYDAAGGTYKGLGQLHDVPALQQLINGVAERVTFHVSGVSAETLALASTEANQVKGAEVAVGIVIFDAGWQQLGQPRWLFRGLADYVAMNQQEGRGGIVRAIELSVGSLFKTRRRRAYSYLTDRDQQARHAGDKFCERTALYSSVTKVWPTF